jgi:hypothetical protein
MLRQGDTHTFYKIPKKNDSYKKYVRDKKVENTDVLWHKDW